MIAYTPVVTSTEFIDIAGVPHKVETFLEKIEYSDPSDPTQTTVTHHEYTRLTKLEDKGSGISNAKR